MTDFTLFVGLDVHKKTISVAMVEAAAGAAVRFYGTIANTIPQGGSGSRPRRWVPGGRKTRRGTRSGDSSTGGRSPKAMSRHL
jgi:hypothetical protein